MIEWLQCCSTQTVHTVMPNPTLLTGTALLTVLLVAWPLQSLASSSSELLAKHSELQTQLLARIYGEPLYLMSQESADHVDGDAYAELPLPFNQLSGILTSASSVCELLFLHLNVRSCQPSAGAGDALLTLTMGPKRMTASGTLYPMVYSMHVEAASASYLNVSMNAAEGPLSTKNYRIVFESLPIDSGHSFLHFSYAYGYGAVAKLAMQVYLATVARSRIGFTVLGQDSHGQARHVTGTRASLERTLMRNYLALLAYCSVKSGTPQEQMEARLRLWFDLTEKFPAQLHELELDEYLQLKNDDLVRRTAVAR